MLGAKSGLIVRLPSVENPVQDWLMTGNLGALSRAPSEPGSLGQRQAGGPVGLGESP